MNYYNSTSIKPVVDSSQQFAFYKKNANQNLMPFLFSEDDMSVSLEKGIIHNDDTQFTVYRDIDLSIIKPYIDSYFIPSKTINDVVSFYETKYNLDYENLCGVSYRGNDKIKETEISSYDFFINKCHELKKENNSIRFLIHTDEKEFLDEFRRIFPDCIFYDETPTINKNTDTCIMYQLHPEDRPLNAIYFFASTLTISKCKYLITHSGNIGNWIFYYRNNKENMTQILSNKYV
jgi:hypothetical protein